MFYMKRRPISAVMTALVFGLVFCQAALADVKLNLPPKATPSYDNTLAVKVWAFFGVVLGLAVIYVMYLLVLALAKLARAKSAGRKDLEEAAKGTILTCGIVVLILALGTTVIFALVIFAAQYLPFTS